jgi:hypothetical protein
MFRDTLTLEEALLKESKGEITILDPHTDQSYHQSAKAWQHNYTALRSKFRHIDVSKLLTFVRARYVIELPFTIDNDTKAWHFLYAVDNTELKYHTKDNIEYVYILINPDYPDLIKIGMTERTVEKRVSAINETSTVVEWVPKFALPISKGNAFRIEQQLHKYFSDVRVTSDQGNEREFFRLDPLTAFDKLREVGALFQAGNPIVY